MVLSGVVDQSLPSVNSKSLLYCKLDPVQVLSNGYGAVNTERNPLTANPAEIATDGFRVDIN